MKRFFIVAFDIVIIYTCIVLAFYLLEGSISETYEANFHAFVIISPIIGILFMVLSYIFGLFNSHRQRLTEVIYTVILTTVTLTVGTMAACYIIQNGTLAFPRSVLLTGMVFYTFTLCIWHIIEWRMAKKAHGIKDILVVGKSAGTLANHIEYTHKDIYRVKYICDENDLTFWDKIKDVRTVFLTSKISESMRDKIFHYSFENELSVYFVPKYSDIGVIHSTLYKTDDIPTYRISRLQLSMGDLLLKRTFDLVVAGIALLLFSPVFLIASLLEKWDNGPVFYTQDRLTLGGKIFKVYKFRSMVPNAENISGPVLADEDDPRITRLGKILRATRMDELPQLINVLKGDMSIVGPRPERPFFADGFTKNIPEYHYRLKVKAGLTGLAQIMGKYNTHVTQKLRYDLMYINQYNALRDVIIVLQTIKVLFMKSSTEGLTKLQKQKQPQGTKYTVPES